MKLEGDCEHLTGKLQPIYGSWEIVCLPMGMAPVGSAVFLWIVTYLSVYGQHKSKGILKDVQEVKECVCGDKSLKNYGKKCG